MPSPFFSVIIPTYNRVHLIGKTLESFLKQSFTDFELLVVDDGSTDNTETFMKTFRDERIRYYKRNKAGVSAARNYGIEQARGEFINFFDSDDIAYPEHLAAGYTYIQSNPDADFVFFDFEWGNPEKHSVKRVEFRFKDPNKAILEGNFPSTNCAFLKRSSLGPLRFNEELYVSEDWEFWLKNSVRHKFYLGKIKTTCLLDHEERSVRNFDIKNLLAQKTLLLDSLKKDPVFYSTHKSGLRGINSHMSSYIAVHGAVQGLKLPVIRLFLISIFLRPTSLFTRRTLAIIKHLAITW